MSDIPTKLAHKLVGNYGTVGKHVGKHQYRTLIRIYPDWRTRATNYDLFVSFERTIRVSDNNSTNDLSPSLGHFPIFETSDYEETLPSQMAAKGGYFLPMHRMFCLHLHKDHVLTAS